MDFWNSLHDGAKGKDGLVKEPLVCEVTCSRNIKAPTSSATTCERFVEFVVGLSRKSSGLLGH